MAPTTETVRIAFNRTRKAPLANGLKVAATHWTRLVGLLSTSQENFREGHGLWIKPCHGVHTLGMRFPIDVVYLDRNQRVVHTEHNLKPWRIAPIRREAVSVLELPPHTLRQTGTIVGDEIEIDVGKAVAAGSL